MTPLDYLLIWFSPTTLFICYLGFVQSERGPKWAVFKVFGLIGYLPDVAWNCLMCMCMGRLPTKPTITVELPILAQLPGLRGEVAIALANLLNRLAPSGRHVQLNHR